MKLRKECGCMKVDDLAMTSISAKKALLGISTFDVQVVTGYDAKFHSLLDSENTKEITKVWNNVWPKVCASGSISVKVFESGKLASWRQGQQNRLIVFGQKLLAAKVWADLMQNQRGHLKSRLPSKFCNEMEELSKALESIKKAATPARAPKKTACNDDFILDLSRIKQEDFQKAHLNEVTCGEIKGLAGLPALRDMAVILFRFGVADIAPHVHVPYFDGLYAAIARSGHPMSSIVFSKSWIAVIRPRVDLPADMQSWCWSVLRDGF
jgi:hypothetical protein